MNNFSVLLVDDDQDVLDSYAHLMDIAGLTARTLNDPTLACTQIDGEWAGVVVIDMYMPQMHGMELLERLKNLDSEIPVIVITGHGDIPMAVEALKKGACDFLEKPINPPQLLERIQHHLEVRKTHISQKQNLTGSIKKEVVGKSAHIELIRNHIAQLALLNSHALITGESGVGRHTFAYLIHQLSHSDSSDTNALLEVDARDVSEPMQLESWIESASTLIVNHIESLTPALQAHLSQALLRRERLKQTRVRLIAILEHSPEQLVQNHKLQPELYYLLSQGLIEVPPLRQRPDDIAALFHYYLKQSCTKLGKALPEVDSHYLQCLRNHDWPGNIRELRNVAELYAIGIVKLAGQERVLTQSGAQLDDLVDGYEKQLIQDALFLFSGKVNEAANYLQVPRKKLYLRMKKHNIDKDDFKSLK